MMDVLRFTFFFTYLGFRTSLLKCFVVSHMYGGDPAYHKLFLFYSFQAFLYKGDIS